MQPSIFQTAKGEMKTKKFLQGERRETILGELYNKVWGREIEVTFKLETDIDSCYIAKVIYDKLKDVTGNAEFYPLEVGIIHSMIIQTQYELDEYDQSFKRKITVNLYEKEQVVVKIKSPPVRKYKKVKVKEERKFLIPYIDGKKPEKDIQEIFEENVSKPLKEGKSWRKEKCQIFLKFDNNIFTIAISQIDMLQDEDNLSGVEDKVSLRRIEVEYQGTQWSDLAGDIPANEREKPGKQDIVKADRRLEKEIIGQVRKISQKVLEICENELCLLLTTA